ncbi:MAG: RNA polymerase sigma factor [Chloroflexota bacterium]
MANLGGANLDLAILSPDGPAMLPVPMDLMDERRGRALGTPSSRPTDFSQVYQQHLRRVYGFIFSQVGNREEAEDLTSLVFLKVYNNLSLFEGRGSLRSWIFQIARTTVNDYWRQRYRLPAEPLPEDLECPPSSAPPDFESTEREKRVHHLLDRLPANYRQVLHCRFLKRYSVKETASAMGITESNVKVLQFRALRRAAELGKDEVL